MSLACTTGHDESASIVSGETVYDIVDCFLEGAGFSYPVKQGVNRPERHQGYR